jgi:hypothetical protein
MGSDVDEMKTRFAKFLAALRRAFAVEGSGTLSAEDLALLDRMARAVVQRRMTGPALVLLESLRPLNYVGSQFLYFLEPLVGSFVSTSDYDRMARILEQRESIQCLIDAIETQGSVPETHRNQRRSLT